MKRLPLVYPVLAVLFLLGLLYVLLHRAVERYDEPGPTEQPFAAATVAIVYDQAVADTACEYAAERQQLDSVCDFRHPLVRDFALGVARQQAGPLHLAQALDIYDTLRARWRFVSDPDGEERFSPASTTIRNGFAGDCDDFAALTAASLMAVGARVRITHAYTDSSGHAYAELDLGASDLRNAILLIERRYGVRPNLHSAPRAFLNLDWRAPHPGGPHPPVTRGIRFLLPRGGCQPVTPSAGQ